MMFLCGFTPPRLRNITKSISFDTPALEEHAFQDHTFWHILTLLKAYRAIKMIV
jgi:hypothetical protein